MFENLRPKFLFALMLGVVVLAGLAVYGDLPKMLDALGRFPLGYIPIILGLTLWNYLLRFLKWQYFLGQIGVRGIKVGDSFAVFFAGLSMVVTPGKIGEWLKSYLLQEMTGTLFSRSAPIIIAERLTDGLAMVLLASGGLIMFREGWQVLLLVVVLALAILLAAWQRPLAYRLLALAEKAPLVSRQVHHLVEFYESSYTLLSPKSLFLGMTIGFFSWGGECLAFYYVLVGLGQEEGVMLAVQSAFILAVSSLGGSIFMAPGGLGIAEGGITGLSQLLLQMPKEVAVTAAIIIRLSTLWFGVMVGALMLLVVTRRLEALKRRS